jgi:hypothetical protein
MSNAITIIAKTRTHADDFYRAVYSTVTTVPIRHSVESAEAGLRGARNRVIYLVDLDLPEIAYLKQLHGSRNTSFVVYWKEPAP